MSNFQQLISGDKPVLVDFTAAWCGPCKMMAPILQQVKERIGDAVTILKVDVDKNPLAAQSFQIQGVPTLILFRKGQPVWRQSGVIPADQLQHVLETH
ncbi:MAG: hypothetical protein RL021_200 [Bacteroidota bacterium]|jgi:thioredoxin 1